MQVKTGARNCPAPAFVAFLRPAGKSYSAQLAQQRRAVNRSPVLDDPAVGNAVHRDGLDIEVVATRRDARQLVLMT